MADLMKLSFADIEEMLKCVVGRIVGTDSDDNDYDSLTTFWRTELAVPGNIQSLHDSGKDLNWYTHAYQYWNDEKNCPADDDGVLGGYGQLTPMDVRDSNAFMKELCSLRPVLQLKRVADLGAGCGRVSKHFLLPIFEEVHLFEQSPRLVREAPAYIGAPDNERVTCHVQVLQDFKPLPNTYDVIWIQWVIGHLHDLDFINFFRQCAVGLRPGGVIVLKDNCTETVTFTVDKEDSSLTRASEYMRLLFTLSGLNVILERKQKDFPEDLCPVHMFALINGIQEQSQSEKPKLEV